MNLKLSQARAEAIKAALVEAGIDGARQGEQPPRRVCQDMILSHDARGSQQPSAPLFRQ
jgi:outer membrane protein OmpA-like peptidoglycan-associated protein